MKPRILSSLKRQLRSGYQRYAGYHLFARKDPENVELLRSCHLNEKDRTVFIVATGPSIKQQELANLSGYKVFSCSNLFLHKDISAISPDFHFFAPFHPPLVESNWLDWVRQGSAALPSKTIIVLGHSDRARVSAGGVLNGRKVIYLYLTDITNPRLDCLGPVMAPQSVPLMALAMALHVRANRVVLLGCDHTTFRDYGKEIQHFYQPKSDIRINASGGSVWPGIEKELLANLKLFAQYRAYARLAASHKIEILNGSPDSWLDIFPRIDTRQEFNV